MSGFSADWLALREGADDAARDVGLMRQVVDWARAHGAPRVLDIGAGTGATLRVLGPLLPGAAWSLADNDAALLDRALALAGRMGVAAEPVVVDLAADLDHAFAARPALVTASAFFDLAGAAWIDAFVDRLAAARAALYAALSYDGQDSWSPPHPEDAAVHAAFTADMGRDKGLGPALGGGAAGYLAAALKARGYRVAEAASPWRLSAPADSALIASLAEGTAQATGASADWLAERRRCDAVMVGHVDLWAVPA